MVLPPSRISNLEVFIGKYGFCPSKVSVQAGFAPLGMTSSYVVFCTMVVLLGPFSLFFRARCVRKAARIMDIDNIGRLKFEPYWQIEI